MGGAGVYINREAVRISPEKAGGTLGRKKWKWEEMKEKVGKNGRERWGVDFFPPNLAQEEAIFLVLLCQINAAFQIFISALRRRGYRVHYWGEKQKCIFIAKSLQRSSANSDFMCMHVCADECCGDRKVHR